MRAFFGLAFALWPGIAIAGSELRAVTPSGLPDMVFKATPAGDASAKLASACMDRGFSVTSSTASEVVCQVPMGTGKSILAQALIGNSNSTPPQQFIRFSIVPIQSDTRVQGSAWIETQMAFGQMRRQSLTSDDANNTLMAFMEIAGASYLHGTTFPNFPYIGTGPVSSVSAAYKGRRVDGIVITTPVAGATLDAAGGKPGDIIVALNDKTFSGLGGFDKLLTKIVIGDPMKITVIRSGAAVELTATAAQRATIQ